jgi:hypothetical protein
MIKVMKNYKIVSVYSGYGEMDVLSVESVKGRSVESVCKKKLKELKKSCKDNLEYFEEFVNSMNVVNDDLGMVGDGEEGFKVVFGESNKWFKLIDEKDSWSEKVWSDWVEDCNSW